MQYVWPNAKGPANNARSTWRCIQGQKGRQGSVDQVDLEDDLVSLVLGANKVTLVRREQQAQQDQLATCHYLDHRDYLVIKAHLGPEAAQVHSTRLFPNVFISNWWNFLTVGI